MKRMRIIFAGAENKNHAGLLSEENVVNPMVSFARIKTARKFKKIARMFDTKLIVDSGAFSAHNLGIKVGLYDYCRFLRKVKKHVEFYFNLDVIGNSYITSANQKKMEGEGLSPIPVFHYGSKFGELEKLSRLYDLVGLGGIASTTINLKWLEKCFKILKKDKTKAHGLGVGSPNLLP
jgi:hypothetical protein